MDLARGLETLFVVAAVSALAPLIVALLPGPRIPQVVVLIAGGVLVGPEGLGLAETPSIQLLANVGLGFLFLLAGYELDLGLFREHPGRLAIIAWLVTVALAAALVGVLTATALPLLVALAEIGLRNGTMLRENAAALVGAGALSVLVFPTIAVALQRRSRAREATGGSVPSE
jgi:Kef-type K+ transport system membrane component KefB